MASDERVIMTHPAESTKGPIEALDGELNRQITVLDEALRELIVKLRPVLDPVSSMEERDPSTSPDESPVAKSFRDKIERIIELRRTVEDVASRVEL